MSPSKLYALALLAAASLIVPVLPLVFSSSAFAPVSRLPGWMQPIARYNPVTSAVDLTRSLALSMTDSADGEPSAPTLGGPR